LAGLIAAVGKIEYFLNKIKQSLQLCISWATAPTAVRWQVWTALLLYVLNALSVRDERLDHSFTSSHPVRAALGRKINLWDC